MLETDKSQQRDR